MSIDERLEALVMTAELHQKEMETLRENLQVDSENIRALARIAEIHERRLSDIEGSR
jgi:hypothetical protein